MDKDNQEADTKRQKSQLSIVVGGDCDDGSCGDPCCRTCAPIRKVDPNYYKEQDAERVTRCEEIKQEVDRSEREIIKQATEEMQRLNEECNRLANQLRANFEAWSRPSFVLALRGVANTEMDAHQRLQHELLDIVCGARKRL